MKRLPLIAVLILVACAYVTPAHAQGSYLTIICDSCRNPTVFPRDYRNFAYNLVFSPAGGLTYGQADFFRIVNLRGQSVLVDMNMGLEVFTLNLGIPIPLLYPIGVQVQIILIYENGDQRTYMIDPRAHPNGLPVGRRARRTPDGSVGNGGGGTSDSDRLSTSTSSGSGVGAKCSRSRMVIRGNVTGVVCSRS